MTLATRCPECGTTFRVVSDQLKLRKGLVKCGQCQRVFNGVEHLRYFSAGEASVIAALERSQEAPVSIAASSALDRASTDRSADSQRSAVAQSRSDDRGAEPMSDLTPTHGSPAATWPRSSRPAAAYPRDGRADFGTFDLHDPDARESDGVAPVPTGAPPSVEIRPTNPNPPSSPAQARPPEPAVAETSSDTADHDRTDRWARPSRRSNQRIDPLSPLTLLDIAATGETASTALAGAPELPEFLRERKRSRRETWIVGFATIVAVIAVAAQLAVVYRAELAARSPWLRGPLEALCTLPPEGARCSVGLPRHVAQLRIASAELQAGTDANEYSLLVTLRNDSPLPQTWPTLDLAVADVRNVVIARRPIGPEEYLRARGNAGAVIARGLPASSEESLALPIRVTDGPVVGYTVGIFYP